MPVFKTESIRIFGTVEGNIWMPAVRCCKQFDAKFTPTDRPFSRKWTGLQDALDRITNDGDFQSCQVSFAIATVRRVYRREGRTEVVRERTLYLNDGGGVDATHPLACYFCEETVSPYDEEEEAA